MPSPGATVHGPAGRGAAARTSPPLARPGARRGMTSNQHLFREALIVRKLSKRTRSLVAVMAIAVAALAITGTASPPTPTAHAAPPSRKPHPTAPTQHPPLPPPA